MRQRCAFIVGAWGLAGCPQPSTSGDWEDGYAQGYEDALAALDARLSALEDGGVSADTQAQIDDLGSQLEALEGEVEALPM